MASGRGVGSPGQQTRASLRYGRGGRERPERRGHGRTRS